MSSVTGPDLLALQVRDLSDGYAVTIHDAR